MGKGFSDKDFVALIEQYLLRYTATYVAPDFILENGEKLEINSSWLFNSFAINGQTYILTCIEDEGVLKCVDAKKVS